MLGGGFLYNCVLLPLFGSNVVREHVKVMITGATTHMREHTPDDMVKLLESWASALCNATIEFSPMLRAALAAYIAGKALPQSSARIPVPVKDRAG